MAFPFAELRTCAGWPSPGCCCSPSRARGRTRRRARSIPPRGGAPRGPVLYTSGAAAAVADRENQESLPSGHASLAFAAATSYLVLARRQHLPHRTRNAILLYAGAVGVSALRVAAGKHFPTDVAAGAALGSGIGWLSATVHPTSP